MSLIPSLPFVDELFIAQGASFTSKANGAKLMRMTPTVNMAYLNPYRLWTSAIKGGKIIEATGDDECAIPEANPRNRSKYCVSKVLPTTRRMPSPEPCIAPKSTVIKPRLGTTAPNTKPRPVIVIPMSTNGFNGYLCAKGPTTIPAENRALVKIFRRLGSKVWEERVNSPKK